MIVYDKHNLCVLCLVQYQPCLSVFPCFIKFKMFEFSLFAVIIYCCNFTAKHISERKKLKSISLFVLGKLYYNSALNDKSLIKCHWKRTHRWVHTRTHAHAHTHTRTHTHTHTRTHIVLHFKTFTLG